MSRLAKWFGTACVLALLVVASGIAGGAAASARDAKSGNVVLIGNFDAPGDAADVPSGYADGATMALADLAARGRPVTWERSPVSGPSAIVAQEAFLASSAKHPDAIVGFASIRDLVAVGPKVAATDVPVVALSSPPEGIRSGPSGGDNIYLIRPLDEQVYAQLAEFACTDLRKQQRLEDVRIALNVGEQGTSGADVGRGVDRAIRRSEHCELVDTTTSAVDATDQAAQVQQIRDSGANLVLSANAPGPTGALVNQLREGGVSVPIVGGEALAAAVDAGSVQHLGNLWAAGECVPELEQGKVAKRFVASYTEQFGAPPSAASAQMYDAVHLLARTVSKAGHDYSDINRALARTDYRGVCGYRNDANNVLARSLTVFGYASPTDPTKVRVATVPFRVARVPFEAVPVDEVTVSTTTVPVP